MSFATMLMAILGIGMATSGAYGQAGEFCHTSAYNLPCGAVQAAKAEIFAHCNAAGNIKLGAFGPANGCACTVTQSTPSKADWDAFYACQTAEPSYAALKAAICAAGRKDAPCAAAAVSG